MRRSDRELKDINDIVQVMEKCDVCRVAFNNDGYPYIVPLNFGMQIKEDKIILYFHGAAAGTKYDLIARDNRAGFEMDCSHKLLADQPHGGCTMEYESVVGRGIVEMVPDEEKAEALRLLMKHYHKEEVSCNEKVIAKTAVFRLVVEQVTGKSNISVSTVTKI